MKVFKWKLDLMGRKDAEHCEDQLRSTKRLQSQVLVLQAGLRVLEQLEVQESQGQ